MQARRGINWSRVRQIAWYEGVIALLIAPVSFPISLWYFESIMPVAFNFALGGWDVAGQITLALLTGFFALCAGLAMDVGLVKIATSPPTSANPWRTLTLWVPVVFWVMSCLITYDKYSNRLWKLDMSTLTHLAYPTASFFAGIYWAKSRNWVRELTRPLHDQIESLTSQVESLESQIAAMADRHARRIQTELSPDPQIAELKAHIDALSKREQELLAQLEQSKTPAADIRSIKYMTAREAIEDLLSGDPERLSNDQLATSLRIKADQLQNFRTQVSQVRAALRKDNGRNGQEPQHEKRI